LIIYQILHISIVIHILFNFLPHINVFSRLLSPLEASNIAKMPYLGPKHIFFRLRNVFKKVITFGAAPTPSKWYIGGLPEWGWPPSIWGFEGGGSQENFGHVTG
jgi:hypothetical protein